MTADGAAAAPVKQDRTAGLDIRYVQVRLSKLFCIVLADYRNYSATACSLICILPVRPEVQRLNPVLLMNVSKHVRIGIRIYLVVCSNTFCVDTFCYWRAVYWRAGHEAGERACRSRAQRAIFHIHVSLVPNAVATAMPLLLCLRQACWGGSVQDR